MPGKEEQLVAYRRRRKQERPVAKPKPVVVSSPAVRGERAKTVRAAVATTPPPSRPPVRESPDTQDYRRQAQQRNLERGAAPHGGPGRAERAKAQRFVSKPRTVRALQNHLRAQGYELEVDGDFGPRTRHALEHYSGTLGRSQQLNARARDQFVRAAMMNPTPDRREEIRVLGAGDAFELDIARRSFQEKARRAMGLQEAARDFAEQAFEDEQDEGIQLHDFTAPDWGPKVQPALERAGRFLTPGQGPIPVLPERGTRVGGQIAAASMFGPLAGNVANRVKPVRDLLDRTVQDVYQMSVGAPGGILVGAAHPQRAAEAVVADYKYRYGPLFEGDVAEFGRRNAEHPLFLGLDIASALQIGFSGARVAGLVSKSPVVRQMRYREGYVQPYASPAQATRRAGHWYDRFSEAHEQAPVVGAQSRVARQLGHDLELELERSRSEATPLRAAAAQLKKHEETAFDLAGRYGDLAVDFLEQEINKRVALIQRPRVPKREIMLQRKQIRDLKNARKHLLNPRPQLIAAVNEGRGLAERTERMKIEMGYLTPETAAERINLPAKAMGELPSIEEVASRTRFYSLALQHLPEGQANAVLATLDSMARAVAHHKGMSPEDFWAEAFSAEKARLGFNPAAIDLSDLPEDMRLLFQQAAKDGTPEVASYYNTVAKSLAGHPGAPFAAQTARRLTPLLSDLRARAIEAQAFRKWYTESATAILEEAGGNATEAVKIAKLLAVFSPRARVWDNSTWNNVTRAIGAYKEFQKRGEVSARWSLAKNNKRDWQTEAANGIMSGTGDWGGLKTNRFYRNFLQDIDPEAYAREFGEDAPVTIDSWMRRAFNYPRTGRALNENVTPEMYEFMARATTAIAKELGWEPREAQAAIWTSIKAQAEGTPLDAAGVSFSGALKELRERGEQLDLFQREGGAGARLEGLPTTGRNFGPQPELQALANAYSRATGIPYRRPRDYAKVDPERAKRIAEEYERMEHAPQDPAVAASYQAMISETMEQYQALTRAGYTFEFPEGDYPYASPWDAMADLRENKHLYVFPTEAGFGTGDLGAHPLLADAGIQWAGRPVTFNDVFRGVHDAFGHHKEGVGFRADGEENAWRQHAAMYSEQARGAVTSETRGQNSWVNYGPHAKKNRTANEVETVYAEQKAGLMPEWVMRDGSGQPGDETPLFQGGHEEFQRRAAEELEIYSALARDIAKTIPEDEWPAWVRNQIRNQADPDALLEDAPTGETFPEEWLTQKVPQSQIYYRARLKGSDPEILRALPKYPTMQDLDRAARIALEKRDVRALNILGDEMNALYQRSRKASFTVTDEPGAIKAAVEFKRGPGATWFSKETTFDEEGRPITVPADLSSFLHEPGHILRRFMPERHLQAVEKLLDVTDGKWDVAAEEKFARLVESYFWRGQEPSPQMFHPMRALSDRMRDLYRQAPIPKGVDIPSREGVYTVLDELFDPALALKPGDGAFYIPDVESWRGKGAGGRAKGMKRPGSFVKPSRGILYSQGRVKRGPEVVVKDYYRTVRAYHHRLSLKQLDKFSDPLDPEQFPETGGIPPGYSLYNPEGVDIPRLYKDLPNEDDLLAMNPREFGNRVRQDYDEVLSHVFPDSAADIPEEMLERVRVLPKKIVDTFTERGVFMKAGKIPGVDKLVEFIDVSNSIAKAALVYGKLSYIPVNFAGNMIFLTIHAGMNPVWAAGALVRASHALGRMDPELLAKMDFEVGEGALASLASDSLDPVSRTTAVLAHYQSQLADRLPRRAAWLVSASRRGIWREADLERVLERSGAEWKDGITYKQIADQIGADAEKAMVQFRGMSPFQKATLSRAIFIYGWMRGATKYAGRMPLDRPIRTDLIAHLGQEEHERVERALGKLVSYMDGLSPVGRVQKALGVDVVPVRQLRALNPVSTGAEATYALYNFVRHQDPKAAGPQLSDYLAPAVKTPIELLTGYNTYFGESYDSRWEAISGPGLRVPAVQAIQGLLAPETTDPSRLSGPANRQPNYVVPDEARARRETFENIFLGSARERLLNVRAGQARGAEERGKAGENAVTDFIAKSKDAGMGTPPAYVLEDLRWRTKYMRASRKAGTAVERYKALAKLYDERNGTDFTRLAESIEDEPSAEAEIDKLLDLFYPDYKQWNNQMEQSEDALIEGK